MTRTQCTGAVREGGLWRVSLRDHLASEDKQVFARGLVNAAGPWVRHLFESLQGVKTLSNVRLVKGSHIVVPRQHAGEHAFILQNRDNRIVFVIPYQHDYSLIGTTDLNYEGDPREVKITPEEIDYLCAIASDYLAKAVTPNDVVWTYSGVRPLYDDGRADPSAITRDYVFELDAAEDKLPLLSVYGGKITTYRELAERALHKLKPFYPAMGPDWTAHGALPGGDFGVSFDEFERGLASRHPGLPKDYLHNLARRHGSHVDRILQGAQKIQDLGRHFGGQLYEREVDWLMREEWALEAADVLWRRTKEGLHLNQAQSQALAEWMAAKRRNSV